MSTTIEVTTPKDEQYLSLHRNWLLHQSEKTLDNAQARLTLIQDILDEGRVRRTDRQEIEALGVAYGDILVEEVPELEWVAVEDQESRILALRWKQSSILVYPIDEMSRQIRDYIVVDVKNMVEGFKMSIYDALEDIA